MKLSRRETPRCLVLEWLTSDSLNVTRETELVAQFGQVGINLMEVFRQLQTYMVS